MVVTMVTQVAQGQLASKAGTPGRAEQEWVLLSYRIPREPSTPRIAIWRKLKDLGVVQIGDGLVGLPFDARTKEHLEWVAARVLEADGEAIVWIAKPTLRRSNTSLAKQMNESRDAEYSELLGEIDTIGSGGSTDTRTLQRWRREYRRIDRRDYFRAPLRDRVRLAIDALGRSVSGEVAAKMPAAKGDKQ